MGSALVALQENNSYAMGEHLSVAFTAVTISLVAASLTFWVASIKKRWFAEELVGIEKQLGVSQ
jgi:biopolymer transport protein ExbB/TolQ